MIEDKIPNYVKCTKGSLNSKKSTNSYNKEGEIFKVIMFNRFESELEGGTYFCEGGVSLYKNYVELSTKKEYEKQLN